MVLETRPWNTLDYLKTRDEQVAYLEAAIAEDDPSVLAEAIGAIARARGVSAFSRETGLSREAIYKAFRTGGNPTLETVSKATKALGLRLTLAPAEAA